MTESIQNDPTNLFLESGRQQDLALKPSEPSPKKELQTERTTAAVKLSERIKQGKTSYIVCSDMDGTIYIKKQNPDGSWQKIGDHHALQEQLNKKTFL